MKTTLKGLEMISFKATQWIGTPWSLVIHTLIFITVFSLPFLGVGLDIVLLVLTTVVSLEAIYLAIFIQMTVNRNTESLEAVEEGIEDIQEDVQGLEGEVEEITEEMDEDEKEEVRAQKALGNIEAQLQKMQQDLEVLKNASLHHKQTTP